MGCFVEFVTTEARWFKSKRVEKLVVIDRLPFDVARWCLQDEDAARAVHGRLEHDAPERLNWIVVDGNDPP